MSDPVELLAFWLDEVGPKGWYEVNAEVDGEIRARFGDLWQAADAGGLDHWVDGSVGTLAFLVLTDQFPRNMFRGSAQAFATDARARDAARRALEMDWDQGAPLPERQFFYLPFEHSEDPADQALAVDCFTNRMNDPETALHARVHQEIIARFGRFPYRNAALGRSSSAEEEAFLQNGGYGAILDEIRARKSCA